MNSAKMMPEKQPIKIARDGENDTSEFIIHCERYF